MKQNYLIKKNNISLTDTHKFEFSDFDIVESNHSFPNEQYICISYAWGSLSIKHPFNNCMKISDRTLSVLQTAYYSYQLLLNSKEEGITFTDKIWIDSICIPQNKDESEKHYFFMGEIYAKSSVVFVILSKEVESVLNKIRKSIQLSENDFELLNNDKWVSRQWTYQEIVNSEKLYFNTEQSLQEPVFASDFLNKISNDINTYTKDNNLNVIEVQKKFPFLISLEAVIVDWKIMEYQERSVYQVMVNMEFRTSDDVSSKIKAMYGCISKQFDIQDLKTNDEYSTFIKLCEKKGDYSFIFNTSINRNIEIQTWKPISYDFKPIYLRLYCYGKGQKGKYINEYLELEDIILKNQGKIDLQSFNHLNGILNTKEFNSSCLIDVIKQNLKELDFLGSYDPIELPNGYFFNQFKIDLFDEYTIGICTGIQWTFGSPAMLLKKNIDNSVYDFVSSGVFFGKIDKSSVSQTAVKIK